MAKNEIKIKGRFTISGTEGTFESATIQARILQEPIIIIEEFKKAGYGKK